MLTQELIETLYQAFCECSEVCTDSRKIAADSIFFALKGDNFNGNLFAEQAIKDGAKYAVVDDKAVASTLREKAILVPDTLVALQELAAYYRKQYNHVSVIGVAGSNGKTTTKELLKAVLSAGGGATYATEGNLNNHIGVPLTILRIPTNARFAIIELGSNHPGEMELLLKISRPRYGVVTNTGKDHLEGYGTIEAAAKENALLYHYVNENSGVRFSNSADELTNQYGPNQGENVTYHLAGDDFRLLPLKESMYAEALTRSGMHIKSKLFGHYNIANIAAAMAVGNHFGIEEEAMVKAIEAYEPKNYRSQISEGKNLIIADCYNANPSSMMAALQSFADVEKRDKLAILGDMLELGDATEAEHLDMLAQLKNLGIKQAVLVGKHFSKAVKDSGADKDYPSFETASAALEYLKVQDISKYAVLLKGSRGIALEKLIEVLK